MKNVSRNRIFKPLDWNFHVSVQSILKKKKYIVSKLVCMSKVTNMFFECVRGYLNFNRDTYTTFNKLGSTGVNHVYAAVSTPKDRNNERKILYDLISICFFYPRESSTFNDNEFEIISKLFSIFSDETRELFSDSELMLKFRPWCAERYYFMRMNWKWYWKRLGCKKSFFFVWKRGKKMCN